jgi:phosphatidylglycerol:prolipoprotein diacylglycerol transferase
MCQTLFYVPHEVMGVPVFGLGWAFAIWCLISAAAVVSAYRQRQGTEAPSGFVPVAVVIGLVILFLLPNLEEVNRSTNGGSERLGLPIRGFGVSLFLAAVAAIWLTVRRAPRVGLTADWVLGLATWVFVAGIIGARAFFVVQYWDEFKRPTWWETLSQVLQIAQGGLVAYGSFLGGFLALAFYVKRRQVPLLFVGDLIAPGIALGLAIGRIGCFLNGCCFGGTCDHWWGVHFPRDSIPYIQQLERGELHGIRLARPHDGLVRVDRVEKSGPAGKAGIHQGDTLAAINGYPLDSPQTWQFLGLTAARKPLDPLLVARRLLAQSGPRISVVTSEGRDISWTIGELPSWTTALHPTQLYSSINALILCLLLLAYEPLARRTGELIAVLLTCYPVTRFALEIIRDDEGSFFQTGLTISQNISVLVLVAAIGIWLVLLRRPPGLLRAVQAEARL